MQKAALAQVHFHFLIKPFFFPQRNFLKQYLITQFQKEGKAIENINYVFCDDAYLLQINQQYLQHDTYTDIVTFELSPPRQPLLADIYISVERIRENAKLYNAGLQQELLRVIFHGALHLCGYKDKSKSQTALMREQENEWLSRYYVSRGKNRVQD